MQKDSGVSQYSRIIARQFGVCNGQSAFGTAIGGKEEGKRSTCTGTCTGMWRRLVASSLKGGGSPVAGCGRRRRRCWVWEAAEGLGARGQFDGGLQGGWNARGAASQHGFRQELGVHERGGRAWACKADSSVGFLERVRVRVQRECL